MYAGRPVSRNYAELAYRYLAPSAISGYYPARAFGYLASGAAYAAGGAASYAYSKLPSFKVGFSFFCSTKKCSQVGDMVVGSVVLGPLVRGSRSRFLVEDMVVGPRIELVGEL